MSASPTPAERLALKTANAAILNSPDASVDIVATIVFALGSAQLLQSPEAAAEQAELRRELESARVDGQRLARAEKRRAELDAVLRTHRDDDRAEIERLLARVAELEAAAFCPSVARMGGSRCVLPVRHRGDHQGETGRHFWSDEHAVSGPPVSGSCSECGEPPSAWCPWCAACSCADGHDAGCPNDVSPQVQKLRGLLAGQRAVVEDPHDDPVGLHHDYAVSRDLPEVTP